MTWAVVAAALLVAVPLALRLGWLVVTVEGPSMQPTLRPGDRLLVRRGCTGGPRPGQIVVLSDGAGLIIKRVAAVPGDPTPPGLPCGPDERVPAGRLVLLGDNTAASVDSRTHGYYERANLVGVAVRPLSRSAP